MAKTKTKKTKSTANVKVRNKQLDSVYILKITAYLILGSQWIHFVNSSNNSNFSLPVGAFIGVILASRDRFQIDRKIEYAILLVALFIGYFLPGGLSILI